MLRPLSIVAVLACAWVSGCGDRVYRTEVAPYLVPCTGYEGQFACLMVREVGATTPYEISYDRFEGLDHQWGHSYAIEYTASPSVHAGAEDSPPLTLRATRVLREELVETGTAFSAVVRDQPAGIAPQVELVTPQQGRFLQGPGFTCSTESVCTQLAELLDETYEARLHFAFAVDPEVRLVLTEVEPLF